MTDNLPNCKIPVNSKLNLELDWSHTTALRKIRKVWRCEKLKGPSIYVKGSCTPNPGVMRIYIVDLKTGDVEENEIEQGTSNLAESIALFEALKLRSQINSNSPIYSDSLIAIERIKRGTVNGSSDIYSSPHLLDYFENARGWLERNKPTNFHHSKDF